MMIPTNYLRYKTVYGECDKNSVSLVVSKYKVLQVWWYDPTLWDRYHEETPNWDELQKPQHGYGEWRDVETVEGA